MSYIIIKEQDEKVFLYEVNLKKKEGWTPKGGICYVNKDSFELFIQAMIKV